MKRNGSGSRRQRGAVAVLTGLMIAVLLGFLGIAVDLGRLFVIKSELQTAMDSCALAAATQLRGDATAVAHAIKFGQAMSDPAARNAAGNVRPVNRANFQDDLIDPNAIQFAFSTHLDGPYQSAGSIPSETAKFVRCTYPLNNVPVFFAQFVGGATSSTVAATAVATLSPSQTNCAVPLAVCRDPGTATAPYGLARPMWVTGKVAPGGNYGTGDFGWVDFPNSPKPAECLKGGGANYLECLLKVGQCEIRTGDEVKSQAASGNMSSLAEAWNSRFGLYRNNPIDSVPDHTGWAYTELSWGDPGVNLANSAYDGVPKVAPPAGAPTAQYNYLRAANGVQPGGVDANKPYQGDLQTGVDTSNPKYTPLSQSDMADRGRDRRLVLAPIVDCSVWAGTGNPKIEDWACVMLLAPTEQGGNFKAKVEFLGLASEPGSPCATSGLPGGSVGPKVPGLVQ